MASIILRTPRAWCTPGKNAYFWQILRKDLRTRLHDSTISVGEYSLERLPKWEFRIYIPPVLLHSSGKEPLSSQRAKSSMEIEIPQFSTFMTGLPMWEDYSASRDIVRFSTNRNRSAGGNSFVIYKRGQKRRPRAGYRATNTKAINMLEKWLHF